MPDDASIVPAPDAGDVLFELVDQNAAIEKIAGGYKFTEGPAWHPDGYLVFSDIPGNTIHRWTPGQGAAPLRTPSGNSNGLAFDQQSRLLACEHGNRRVSRQEADGSIVTLADEFEGQRLNSPNDLIVARGGSIYFTDPPYGLPQSERDKVAFCGVYRIAPDGKLQLLTRELRRPNGLFLSPDESKLYVVNSEPGFLQVFDVQPDGGLSNSRPFANMAEPGVTPGPDGMVTDEAGDVFCTGPAGVWVFAPDARFLGKIIAPEPPANVTWGNDDRRTLYLTARTSVYRVQVKTQGR